MAESKGRTRGWARDRSSRSHTAFLGLASTEPDGYESRAPHSLRSFAHVLEACPPEEGPGSSALRYGLLLPPPPAPRDPRGGPTVARRAEPRTHSHSVAMTAIPPPLRGERGALVASRAHRTSIGPDEAGGRASSTSGSPIGRLAVEACGGGELVSASRVIPARCGRKQMVSAFPFPYARLAARGPRRSASRSLQGAGDGRALTALPPGPQRSHLGSVAGPQRPAAQTCAAGTRWFAVRPGKHRTPLPQRSGCSQASHFSTELEDCLNLCAASRRDPYKQFILRLSPAFCSILFNWHSFYLELNTGSSDTSSLRTKSSARFLPGII